MNSSVVKFNLYLLNQTYFIGILNKYVQSGYAYKLMLNCKMNLLLLEKTKLRVIKANIEKKNSYIFF